MSDHRGTEEQHQHHPPAQTEYGYLMLATAALTLAGVLCAVDHLTATDLSRGVYSILAGLFVVGGCGWIVRSGDSQRRRDLAAGRDELLDQLAELTSKVDQVRRSQAPRPASGMCRPAGHIYPSPAAVDGDTEPMMPRAERPVDPDALREEVERVVVEELGTRDAVRSQGYAEGYVDGLARRGDDPAPD